MVSENAVSSRGTFSHKVDGKIKEVVVITVTSDLVGSERRNPPNPYDFSFSHEVRSTYFNDGSKTGVQFPRWSNEYSPVEDKLPLEEVTWDGDRVFAVYSGDDQTYTITWDVNKDEWDYTTTTPDTSTEYNTLWEKNRTTTPLS
jgi:hypothetical protein